MFLQTNCAFVCIHVTFTCVYLSARVRISGCEAQWVTSGKLPGKLGATTRTRSLVHPRCNQFELSYAHESWLGLNSMQISFVSSEESHFAGTYLGPSRALGT